VHTVLGSLAEGMTVAEILLDFPTLDENAVSAVIAFAAVFAEEDLFVQAVPTINRCRIERKSRILKSLFNHPPAIGIVK
jgi:hypothetical protein